MFWLVLLLGVALILANGARRPGTWRWLDRLAGATPRDDPAPGVDNRMRPERQSEFDRDGFIIPKWEPEPESSKRRREYFPGVDPDLLERVRDDAFFTAADRECTLNLLHVLEETDRGKIQAAAEDPVTYAQLFRQPEHYRGRLVSISGAVSRVARINLGENQYGIDHYFEVMLVPNVKPPAPVIVYCLRLPDGFPIGEDLSEEAKVTGFFLKRCAYHAEDGLRTAPTVLAKSLQWRKRPGMPEEPPVEARKLIPAIVGAALLAIIVAWYVYRRTRPSRPAAGERPPDFELLEKMDQGSDAADEGR